MKKTIYKISFYNKNMDEHTARAKLDNISGYIHPTETKTSRGNLYKIFSTSDTTKNQNIDNFKSTVVSKSYKSNGSFKDTCPFCNTTDYITCPCVFNDKTCKYGHTWYYDRDDGKLKKGKPHL